MVNTILFDLGETLIHIDPKDKAPIEEARFKMVQNYLLERGYNFTVSSLRGAYARSVEALTSDPEEEVHIQRILAEMLERLSINGDLIDLIELEKVFYQAEIEAWTLFPDAIPCLEYALEAGFELGLISNARSDWAVRSILERLKLDKYFRAVVTSAQVGWRKPRPEPFFEALRILKKTPRQAAFVGDTFSADIIGAKKIGMKAIYLNRNNDPIPTGNGVIPDYVIRNLREGIEVIKIFSERIRED